jgi:hypothetical protein
MTTETALTLPQRAALALESSKTEVRLRELVASTADMVEVLNKAARDQIHSAAMTYRDHRVTIEKTGKASRDDATKFSKAVIAEEARLIDIITPEEKRLLALRDSYDAKIEAEKQAKLAVERARVEAQQGLIDVFGKLVLQAAGRNSAYAKELLAMLVKLEPSTPTFDEDFIDRARTAWDAAYESLDTAYSAAFDAEQAAEAAKLKREEEDRQRAAEAAENERVRVENARIAAEMEVERQRIAKIAAEQEAANTAEEKRLAAAAEAQRVELARAQKEADDKIKAAAAIETARIQAEADARALEHAKAMQLLNDQRAAFEAEQVAAQKVKDDAAKLEADHAEALEMDMEWVRPVAEEEFHKSPYMPVAINPGAIADALIADAIDLAPLHEATNEPTDEEIVIVYMDVFGGTVEQAIARLKRFNA